VTDFVDFTPAPVAVARFILSDGREFTFAAHEDAAGLHFAAVEGEGMTSDDLAMIVAFERIDAAGRVTESLRQAAAPLQS
jgi:hypothetical protein